MAFVKKISAFLFALLVFGLCVLNINTQSHAVDVDGYPEHIPTNLVILNITFLSGDTTDSFYMQLPLPMDDVTDSSGRWNMRDSDGNIVGTYHISYSEGLLSYSFRFNNPVIDVYADFSNLVYTAKGEEMTFLKFTADQPFTGVFSADTFHINRSLDDTTLSQSVSKEPLYTTFPTLAANTYANATLTASGYDVFTQFYSASFYRVDEGFSEFTLVVPARLWEPLDIVGSLGYSLDFEQDLAETIVVSDFPTNWTEWLGTAVSGFMNMEIAPGLSIGIIFASVFGVLMLWFLLHLFM